MEADDFGFVIPASNLEGGQVVRLLGFESGDLLGRERSALEFEAAFGGLGEVGEVAGLGSGQVPLGVHVKSHAIEHGLGKMTLKKV